MLLKTRLIVITPMTNPAGYANRMRAELVDTTRKIDINRDFPYLVDKKKCMQTLGARVVNELFISHLFSLALTLHGGTESFTYPFGAPNHLKNNKFNIPLKYSSDHRNKIKIDNIPESHSVADRYRKGEYKNARGSSTESPDNQAMKSISGAASINCSDKPYKTGDMSSLVYPVTGGMEDWAYAGSWEGSTVITQPCTPETYGGYSEEKTLYEKNYKESLKAIMFLFEISRSKAPTSYLLGKKEDMDNCFLNIRYNAFNIFEIEENKLNQFKKKCLDSNQDGYIYKVVRLSLSLIDLLHPYFSANFINLDSKLEVQWVVGGAIKVEETYLLYDFSNSNDVMVEDRAASRIGEKLKNKSEVQTGNALWSSEFSKNNIFKYEIDLDKSKKYLLVMIVASVDKDWLTQDNPDPKVYPQTHIVNLRNKETYSVKNGKYELKGSKYFYSELYYYEIGKK